MVTLICVPGHSNVFGNETADTLAKEGASLTYTGQEPFCGLSLNHVKTILKSTWLKNAMQHYWNTLPGMSHTKVFIPSYSYTRSEELLRLNRKQIRVMTGLLTGHLQIDKKG